MSRIQDVASYPLSVEEEQRTFLTITGLQRMLYQCQAWNLVRYNTVIFPDNIYAGQTGPIMTCFYDYRYHGQHIFSMNIHDGNWNQVSRRDRSLVDRVITAYSTLGDIGELLDTPDYKDLPWKDSLESPHPIPTERMKHFYTRLYKDHSLDICIPIPVLPEEELLR